MGLCHVKYKIVDPHLTWAHSPKPPKVGQYHSPLTPPLLVPPMSPPVRLRALMRFNGFASNYGYRSTCCHSRHLFLSKVLFQKSIDSNSSPTQIRLELEPNPEQTNLTSNSKNLLIYTFKMILALYISSPTTIT